MELTARDHDIIRHVGSHRFLRSLHIIALAGGSQQQVLRRLQVLYHRGYLERPPAQLDYYGRAGSRHIVYGLGDRGAILLRKEGLAMRGYWGSKNRAAGRMFLEHALLVSDVMTAIELACRKSGVRVIAEPAFDRKQPFRWSVTLSSQVRLGVVPDRVFGLGYQTEDGRADRAYFFLEADRGTMPVMRANLSQTSFHRKLLAYQATWETGIHRTRFNFHRFRVLVVTTSPVRMQSIANTCKQLPRGRGLFLFATTAILKSPADVMSAVWRTANGESAGLMD